MNEHSLVVQSDDRPEGRPRLDIFDTNQGTDGKPTQTSFYLSTIHDVARFSYLVSEPCGHVPSPDELMTAPFYPDPTQRILALCYNSPGRCFVINVELLLELAREREGQYVGWEEWVLHTIEVQVGPPDHIWVSGCQLYCTVSDVADEENDESSHLQIYDFSHAGRSKHLHTLNGAAESGGTRQISPALDGYKLPWNAGDFRYVSPIKGHDTIAFFIVSVFSSSFPLAYSWSRSVKDVETPVYPEGVLHVWSL